MGATVACAGCGLQLQASADPRKGVECPMCGSVTKPMAPVAAAPRPAQRLTPPSLPEKAVVRTQDEPPPRLPHLGDGPSFRQTYAHLHGRTDGHRATLPACRYL